MFATKLVVSRITIFVMQTNCTFLLQHKRTIINTIIIFIITIILFSITTSTTIVLIVELVITCSYSYITR